MKLTEIAIRRPAFITMIFVTLAVLGIFGYSRMGVDLLPKMDWPFVSIVTVYPGAGPKEVESLVSKPLEEAVSGINKLDNVRSYSYEGRFGRPGPVQLQRRRGCGHQRRAACCGAGTVQAPRRCQGTARSPSRT